MNAGTFARIFARRGQPVTFIRRTPGAPNPTTLRPAPATSESIPARGVVRGYRHHEVNGQAVRIGDRKVMLDPRELAGVPPDTDDRITIDGVTVGIVNVRIRMPDGPHLAYDCQVRGLE